MIERLYIQEIQKELPFRDRRTLKKWCRNNGVGIFTDLGSNRLFVIKAEFEAAKMNQVISYIKQKYGEDKLPEYFNSLTIFFSKSNNTEKANEYKPLGEYENKFLNCLQNL